jgi:hypothetical protein
MFQEAYALFLLTHEDIGKDSAAENDESSAGHTNRPGCREQTCVPTVRLRAHSLIESALIL